MSRSLLCSFSVSFWWSWSLRGVLFGVGGVQEGAAVGSEDAGVEELSEQLGDVVLAYLDGGGVAGAGGGVVGEVGAGGGTGSR